MSDQPISLEQVLKIGNFAFQFSTSPSIPNRQLFEFYSDIGEILMELDPEINYNGKPYVNLFKGITSWPLDFFLKIRNMNKTLQVREEDPEIFSIENGLRTYSITYRRKPVPHSKNVQERIRKGMFGKILSYLPNVELSATRAVLPFEIKDLFERLTGLPYVGISDRYTGEMFDLDGVVDAARDPSKILTSDGKIISLE